MERVVQRTWVPTVLFAGASTAVASRSFSHPWPLMVAVAAMMVAPVAWWRLVSRHDAPRVLRGGLAGGFIGAAIPLAALSAMQVHLTFLRHGRHPELGAIGDAIFMVVVLRDSAIGAALGSAIGAGVLALPRWWAHRAARP